MKHVHTLSKELPVQAQETAWIELKNIIGFSLSAIGLIRQLFTKQNPPPPDSND